MITDNMRKENAIIVEALTKMREGAQAQVAAAFGYDSRDDLEHLVKAISELDALIDQHAPKQPTKNEAVVDKIADLSRWVCWPDKRLSKLHLKCVLRVLNEEYPE
tara:strand:+ start:3127 stop:3441 length:315 start_codon:yes stop_codon:yes gene_type:complete